MLQPDWTVHVKKNFKTEVINLELRKVPELEGKITMLDKDVKRLMSMHNAKKRD